MAQPEPLPPAALALLLRRRVPPEKRQRTAMSCDFCRRKRCKCSRPSSNEPCRACTDNGEVCRVTEPRKPRGNYRVPLATTLAVAEGPHKARGMATGESQESSSSIISLGARACYAAKESSGEAFFEDLLGLPQYIGPTGSYTLLVTLRKMLSVRYSLGTSPPEAAQTMGLSTHYTTNFSPVQSFDLPPREISDTLIEAFFVKVHRDFPIFHRAIFQTSYESMWSTMPETDPAWLMTLYMVFVLALETTADNGSTQRRLAAQSRYLAKAKTFLPEVIAGCTLSHIQALMLYCLQMHISRERNASWNITGASIRIAVAIGLHRNGVNPKCSPLERELRKRVWWTIYAFERLECSSLGRPSVIDDSECNTPVPTEGFLDMGDILPIGHLEAQADLLRLIGVICKNQYNLHELSEDHVGFVRDISKQLDVWHRNLPAHLRIGAEFPKLHFRSITMLHLQHQYATTLLVRPFLASRTRRHVDSSGGSLATEVVDSLARQCTDAAIVGIDLLQALLSKSCFNSKTSWDVYFMESFSMILAIGKFAHEGDADSSYLDKILAALETGLNVLKNCDSFSATMERFAHVTADFSQTVVVAAKSEARSPPGGTVDERTSLSPRSNSAGDYRAGPGEESHDIQSLSPSLMEYFLGGDQGYETVDMGNPMSWEDFSEWALQHH
ncbi:hypothetical protein CONLIGDRAFT_694810 [Coniochaeta ligniaria NRRL 30616]|uniref:Zn(2)-C6 fungal-type domain-containing protein n=1 Tax=Coniochaeta ligniaria NRRL 30616 TaxID=1408157 RepID=A0A1J7IP28_9PEZI|nr:hypothetical protein CONLIGDRAFT_694810 [Coniochaeta ligniaria NRRL 30616]